MLQVPDAAIIIEYKRKNNEAQNRHNKLTNTTCQIITIRNKMRLHGVAHKTLNWLQQMTG